MSFWKRLRIYLVGFGLGLLITYMFFGDRACGSWLPGNRVKASITELQFLTSDYMDCQMEASNFTFDSIVNFIVNSDVVFNKSDVGENPKIYYLTDGKKSINFVLDFEDSTSYIQKMQLVNTSDCDTLNKFYTTKVDLPLKKK